jgi:Rhs element Vgr protein
MSIATPTILSDGLQIGPSYELLSIDVRREVNRIPSAHLYLIDGDSAKRDFPISNDATFEPGKEVEIKMGYEGEPKSDTTVFKGRVIRHGVEANDEGSLLTVELKDAAIKLTQARKSSVFRDQSDDQVIGKIIDDAGLKKGELSSTELKHPEIVQYYCTDWDFILSRADINGLLVIVNDGEISLAQIDLGGSAKHRFEYGLDEIYNFEIEADAGSQFPDLQSIGWDVKNQKPSKPAKAKAFSLSIGNLDGAELAKTVGFGPYILSHPVPLDPKELQAWADGRMTRSRMSLIRGRVALPGFGDLKLLDVMEIAGIGKRFNGKTLVSGICHRLDEQGWRTDIQFGLSSDAFCRESDIQDVAAAGLLPAVSGLQIGIVDKFEEDPDKELRVKVILPGLDAKTGAVWARLASPDAGKDRGWFFRPETGDEVVLGFFNEDPRKPVILGALFGSKNSPPADFGAPSEKNLKKGFITKAGTKLTFTDDEKASLLIETKGQGKIMLDDDKESIQISDKHGNSLLMDKSGIHLKSGKDLKFEASGNVEIKGTKVDVK